MEIGTVKADKKLKIYTIKGKRVDREDFRLGAHVGEEVPIEASGKNIKNAVDKALASNGKVCGIYQEKKLVGIYVFERIEDYFIEAGKNEAMAGERRMESQEAVRKLKEIFEDSKAAMKLILWYLPDALSDQKNKIEDMIRNYMKGCMSDGFWAGIEWGDELVYKKNMDPKEKKNVAFGYLLGAVVGFAVGWLAMDNITFGICYAVIFSNLYGNMIFGGEKNKKVWETFVFVNPKYHDGEENHDAAE